MIGKTRRTLDDPPPAVLHRLPATDVEHWRRAPDPALAPWIEHWWGVRWDLSGRPPRVQETLPHPVVHVVAEPGLAAVWGVPTRRFSRTLAGRGAAFGVKFRVGAFRAFLGAPVSTLVDRHVPVEQVFPDGAAAFRELAGIDGEDPPDADDAIARASRALFASPPRHDPQAALAEEIAALAEREPGLHDVAGLARASGLSARSLQRLFADYVGVSPKWVLCRYRLHEAVARAQHGEDVSWADLAQSLGYFDQAHLIADFRALVGWTPAQYARRYPLGTAPVATDPDAP